MKEIVYNGVRLRLQKYAPAAMRRALGVYREWGAPRAEAETGVRAQAIRDAATRCGVAHSKAFAKRLERSGLSAHALAERDGRWRRLYKQGWTAKEIAAVEGVDEKTVCDRVETRDHSDRITVPNQARRSPRGRRRAREVLAICAVVAEEAAERAFGAQKRAADRLGISANRVNRAWWSPHNAYNPEAYELGQDEGGKGRDE